MKLSRAITFSIIGHVVMIALLAFNFQFSKIEIKPSKTPRQMNAVAVNANSVKQQIKNIKQKDTNKKNKEIETLRKLKKEQEKVSKKRIEEENKEKKAKQRQKDAEKKRKQEEKKVADSKKKRIADEKARKKKIATDKKKAQKKKAEAAERKRKKKADAEKKRKEVERKKKLAKEKATQEALEKELEQQMSEEAAALNSIQQQYILTEADKYKLLIENKIRRHFIEPEQSGYCNFRIKIAPGGLIIGINVVGGDPLYCDTGRRAINKAEPLPMSTDPDVYAALKELFFQLKNKDKE